MNGISVGQCSRCRRFIDQTLKVYTYIFVKFKERGDVISLLKRLTVVSIFLMFSAPVSADLATHIYLCTQDEDVTDDQVETIAAEWLEAARKVEGGKDLELYLNFPVAAQAGEVDFAMMLTAPGFAEWGEFMDNYPDSAAADIDDNYEDEIRCGDATLWESMKVE